MDTTMRAHKKKILYYQCFSGISGDMNMGAMVDLGVPEDYLVGELEKIELSNVKVSFKKDSRNAIYGTHATVSVMHPTLVSRNLRDIREIIDDTPLDQAVKETAKAIFQVLAEAEAKVHRSSPEKIHFHEVGGEDAIIDIVGAAIAFHYLQVDEVWASTIEMGQGFVKSAHGIIPVPAPATVEILKNKPLHFGGTDFETTTPTGAAILSTLVTRFTDDPGLAILQTGYGIGNHKGTSRPNLLRTFLAESIENTDLSEDVAEEIECTIDDMNPEWYDWIITRLFEAGALDVTLTPVFMKKNRPGMKICVLAPVEKSNGIGLILLKETTTIGFRRRRVRKNFLVRKISYLDTRYGKVRIKEAYLGNALINRKPEYDDCRKIAMDQNIPLKQLYEEINILLNDADRKNKT